MPRANEGTLLENVVLVEVARLVLEQTPNGAIVEFVNSFVMPPLSQWNSKSSDRGMTGTALERITNMDILGSSYTALMKLVLQPDRSKGPSGALLFCLLAAMEQRTARFWLNDLDDDNAQLRYPDETSRFDHVPQVASQLLNQSLEDFAVSSVGQPFPQSLNVLQAQLTNWNQEGKAAARIGYLDPDFYAPNGRADDSPQTDSDSVRRYLQLLKNNFVGPVVSAHFTCNQMGSELQKQVLGLLRDGTAEGFNCCVFSHRHFAVVIHHANWPTTSINEIETRVRDSWSEWGRLALNRPKPYMLHFTCNGTVQ